ncbi:DUF1366 domain-containing protein [Streptococcus sp. A23]|uniref:DUF1366 domain-containing protein n=1 Tax=Streptococcus sp. A23 TaxID=3373127 RepID=UPI00374DF348
MDFIYASKSLDYHLDGSPKHTRLVLTDEQGSQIICLLPSDSINKTNEELVEEGSDWIYNNFFPKRAENEKFGIVDKKIAELDEATIEMKKLTHENREMLRMVTTIVNSIILPPEEEEEGAIEDEEPTEETI